MTKIIGVFAAAMLMLGVASNASAWWTPSMPSNDVSVRNVDTHVLNVAGSVANTGLVSQNGGLASRQTLYTGAVADVYSNAQSDVNMTILPACSSCSRGDISVKNKDTKVANISVALASTGVNSQSGSLWSSQTMGTGTVNRVGSTALTSVNYTNFSVSQPH